MMQTLFRARYRGDSSRADRDVGEVMDSLKDYLRNAGLDLSKTYTGVLPIPLMSWPLVKKCHLIAQDSKRKVIMTYNTTSCLEYRFEAEGEGIAGIQKDLKGIYKEHSFSIED